MRAVGKWTISVISSQFCCEPTNTLKKQKLLKNQHLFSGKECKTVIKENYLNILKVIHEKPTANLILIGERMKAYPLIRTAQGYLLFQLLFNIV